MLVNRVKSLELQRSWDYSSKDSVKKNILSKKCLGTTAYFGWNTGIT